MLEQELLSRRGVLQARHLVRLKGSGWGGVLWSGAATVTAAADPASYLLIAERRDVDEAELGFMIDDELA